MQRLLILCRRKQNSGTKLIIQEARKQSEEDQSRKHNLRGNYFNLKVIYIYVNKIKNKKFDSIVLIKPNNKNDIGYIPLINQQMISTNQVSFNFS